MAPSFDVRKASPEDINFIYSTWLDSFVADNCFGNIFNNGMFYRFYRTVIDQILARPDTYVFIACANEDPHLIYAYAVIEGSTLHYLYTRGTMRNLGIAKTLLKTQFLPETILHTHQTGMVKDILKRHKEFVYKNVFQKEQ